MKGVADVFVESGSIPSSLESYECNVNTGPLAAASACNFRFTGAGFIARRTTFLRLLRTRNAPQCVGAYNFLENYGVGTWPDYK